MLNVMCEAIKCVIIAIICVCLQSAYSVCDLESAKSLGFDIINSAAQHDWLRMGTNFYGFMEECRQSVEPICYSEYDITINSEWSHLPDLGTTKGWTVQMAGHLQDECSQKEDITEQQQCINDILDTEGCYVAWTGGFNKGKTTRLSYNIGFNFPAGYGKDGETKGFNFILPRDGTKVIHIDLQGTSSSVAPGDLRNIFMTDQFVYEILPDLADIVIIVVDILTNIEQVAINELMDRIISFTTANHPKELIVLHNFKTLSTIKDVEQFIDKDIMTAFPAAEPVTKQNGDLAYYKSQYKGYPIYHYVFAMEHTEAGQHYNARSNQWLSQHTNDMRCNSREVNVLEHFMEKLERVLREYFYSQNPTAEVLILGTFDKWASKSMVLRWMGNTMDAISGAASAVTNLFGMSMWSYGDGEAPKDDGMPRIEIDNEWEDPFTLIFKHSLTQNKTGTIMTNQTRILNPCQSAKISEMPQCRPRIECYVWDTEELWAVQCKMSDIILGEDAYVANFSVEIQHKVFQFIDDEDCELIIKGTILPPWREFVDETNVEEFRLLRSDGVAHGFVHTNLKMPNKICHRYENHHDIDYSNGILSIKVKKRSRK